MKYHCKEDGNVPLQAPSVRVWVQCVGAEGLCEYHMLAVCYSPATHSHTKVSSNNAPVVKVRFGGPPEAPRGEAR